MKELERLDQNNEGQRPKEGHINIVRVTSLDNPDEVLSLFKEAVKVILEHPDLDKKSKKWRQLLPERMVRFVDQLDEEDYWNDELLESIDGIIDEMRNPDQRHWEWYSSKLTDNGFEVVTTGKFHLRFLWFIHTQGIPQSKMFIVEGETIYPIKMLKDVTQYKTFK